MGAGAWGVCLHGSPCVRRADTLVSFDQVSTLSGSWMMCAATLHSITPTRLMDPRGWKGVTFRDSYPHTSAPIPRSASSAPLSGSSSNEEMWKVRSSQTLPKQAHTALIKPVPSYQSLCFAAYRSFWMLLPVLILLCWARQQWCVQHHRQSPAATVNRFMARVC